MLTVYRQQACTALLYSLQKHTPAHHEGFLVGKQKTFTRAGSCQAGLQSSCADDSGHDRVNLLMCSHFRNG